MTHYTDGLVAVAAVLTALTIIGGVLWKLYGLTKRIEEAIGVDGDGHTLASRVREATSKLSEHVVQADKVLARVDHRIAHLEEAVEPEGELSLAVRVKRAENDLATIKTHVDRVGSKVDVLSSLLRSDIRERKDHEDDE